MASDEERAARSKARLSTPCPECGHEPALTVALVEQSHDLRTEVERLTRAAAWLPDGHAPALTLEHLRGIKIRWATGPDDYQADADALIGAVERLTRERDEARRRYADLCIGEPDRGDAYAPPAHASVTMSMRDAIAAERERVERLRLALDELLGAITAPDAFEVEAYGIRLVENPRITAALVRARALLAETTEESSR